MADLSFIKDIIEADYIIRLSRYIFGFLLIFSFMSYIYATGLGFDVPYNELNLRPWFIIMKKQCSCPQPPTSTTLVRPSLITRVASLPHTEILKFIIDNARDGIDMQTRSGWSALHFASYCNHSENVLLLCNHGADVNLKNNYGQTALHISSTWKLTRIAKGLITFGADVNVKDKVGDAPLHRAASVGDEVLCELLINFGAEVDPKNINKETPLIQAIKSRHKKVAVLLIRKGANYMSLIEPDEQHLSYFDRIHVPKDFQNSLHEAVLMMDAGDGFKGH